MRRIFISFSVILVALAGADMTQAKEKSAAAKTRDDCKVVEQQADKDGNGTLSSSVTAGGGRVSAHTTGAGNGITVHSANGGTSSVATAGSSRGTSVVAGTGSGDCTISIQRKK